MSQRMRQPRFISLHGSLQNRQKTPQITQVQHRSTLPTTVPTITQVRYFRLSPLQHRLLLAHFSVLWRNKRVCRRTQKFKRREKTLIVGKMKYSSSPKLQEEKCQRRSFSHDQDSCLYFKSRPTHDLSMFIEPFKDSRLFRESLMLQLLYSFRQ